MLLTLLSLWACTGSTTDTPIVDSAEDSGQDSGEDSGQDTAAPVPSPGRFFPDDAPWYQRVDTAAVDPQSPAKIAALQEMGWGFGRFQMDFSLEVLEADADTPVHTVVPVSFYEPDCELMDVPLPVVGNTEGETGYACTNDGDCHVLVADRDAGLLYEVYRGNLTEAGLEASCSLAWDMTQVYPGEGRGEQCTSADAAGYPITPLLFTADELASGRIEHAIRFALPNDRITNGVYHHPASHGTNAQESGPIPYGSRLRLKADFDMERISDPDARVIAVALQEYGMLLADGGNITLMGESDRYSEAKWEDMLEDFTHALVGIEPQDFELLQLGQEVPLTFECERNGL